jgi:uncharacterized glyoxalase superfamily protein PhnB
MDRATRTGSTTVAPWIVTEDTRGLLAFIGAAFDGVELAALALEDGTIGHAEILVGDTVLFASDRRPGAPGAPALLRVLVEEADATVARAVEAGASVVSPPADDAFGQRVGRVRDPFGNLWSITGDVTDAPREEDAVDHRHRQYAHA